MLSRTQKSAAVAAAVLAAAALAAAPSGAQAADECLTAPKATTPAGAHWYYRLEKGTKRKCWYLADEVSKATRPTAAAATPTEASADEPAPPVAKPKATHNTATRNTTARKSIADARAELTTPEDDQPALAATTWPPLEPSAEIKAAPADTPPAAAPELPASNSWTIATRWPDPKAGGVESSAPDERAAALRATATPQETATDPLRIALIALTAALLALAVAGRLLLRRVRRTPRPATPRAIWPDERADHPDALRTSADVEEIESLLRASRSATG
jgi:hypothetical protein